MNPLYVCDGASKKFCPLKESYAHFAPHEIVLDEHCSHGEYPCEETVCDDGRKLHNVKCVPA